VKTSLRQRPRLQPPHRMAKSIRQGHDTSRSDSIRTIIAREPRLTENESMASYALLAIVIGLVIYLFYAVINPEKF
jgi:K+-transporting ATPase KdpF subunit